MGTHPIFESDFDCLTEIVKMKIYSVSRTAARALSTTSSAAHNHLPIQFGLGEWWCYVGKVKKSKDVVPFNHAVGTDATNKAASIDASNAAGVINAADPVDAVVPGCTGRSMTQARFVENAENEPGWFIGLNKWKLRQDLGGHCTKYGALLDDFKNILDADYATMRDRQYDADRQNYHYRITVADQHATTKEIMPYEQWSPLSADHHYLNPIGRQLEAELDEQEMVNTAIGQPSIFYLPPLSFRTWGRNFMTYMSVKKSVDDSVLRSQF